MHDVGGRGRKRDEPWDISRYEDMLDLPHPTSKTHPRMGMVERAAQFAPFAALSGHGDVIKEAERGHSSDSLERAEFEEDI